MGWISLSTMCAAGSVVGLLFLTYCVLAWRERRMPAMIWYGGLGSDRRPVDEVPAMTEFRPEVPATFGPVPFENWPTPAVLTVSEAASLQESRGSP